LEDECGKSSKPNVSVAGESFLRRELDRIIAQLNAGMRRGKSLEKDGSRVPHGEALLMALFLQQKQVSANHPIPLI
jgi:hypothetical protein